MKVKQLFLGTLCASALFSTTSHAQSGGQFDLTWSTIDNGGGASSGGQFQLRGSVGQHDAGTLAGGNFTVEGGFWSGITVLQMPGAPVLKIRLVSPEKVVISWPVNVTGFTLEESSALGKGLWAPTSDAVVDTATEHTVTIPGAGVIKCFRLKHP